MDIMDFSQVGVITIICYLICQIIKQTPLNNKWLPAISGTVGAILGVIGMMTMPAFPAGDILTAIAVGIVSGLAATGAHQVYKQLRH